MKARQMDEIEVRLNSPDWRIRADAKAELDEDIRQGNQDDLDAIGDYNSQLDYE